ncbi:MAG: GNAT family N-acetyltransferase [Chitinophagaceae bacterium]|nr:GNAT family N-acetyltransferase [Chitinophagaceae bacterium]
MALKQIDFGTAEYRQMLDLRYEILRKPLGLNFTKEELEHEKYDLLIAAFEDEKMLGCCFLSRVDHETVRLRQMAVQNNVQGKGIGASLINFAENLARDRGYKTIIMNARKATIHFFEKQGYKVDGDEFIMLTIPHVVMKKRLL